MFEAGIEATAWARTSTLRLRLRLVTSRIPEPARLHCHLSHLIDSKLILYLNIGSIISFIHLEPYFCLVSHFLCPCIHATARSACTLNIVNVHEILTSINRLISTKFTSPVHTGTAFLDKDECVTFWGHKQDGLRHVWGVRLNRAVNFRRGGGGTILDPKNSI